MKIDADKIKKDVERRQIPRFADAPPGASTLACVEALQTYCSSDLKEVEVDLFNWLKDFRIQDIELLTQLQQMNSLKAELLPIGALKEPTENLKTVFLPIYEKQVVEDEIKMLEWSLGKNHALKKYDEFTLKY